MTIDDTVELDLTIAQMAEDKAKKAFWAGCWFALGKDAISKSQMEQAWQDHKNVK